MGKLRGTSKGQVTLKPDFLKHLAWVQVGLRPTICRMTGSS
jgi:hypothetical protein